MAATIKDIKEETGLSLATISKYLNGGKVLEENAQRIRDAVEKLHYQPNEMARSLVTNKTRTVGVICYNVAALFSGMMIKHVGDYLRSKGYSVLISDSDNSEIIQEENIRFMISKKVDGIIIIPVSARPDALHLAREAHIPIVLLDRDVRGGGYDTVLVNNYEASLKLMECLIQKHHKKIALISSDSHLSHVERNRAYIDTMLKEGLPIEPAYVRLDAHSIESGYSAMKALMTLDNRPTAVFSTGYDFNLGIIMALNEIGARLPEEMSIVGFDDLLLPRILHPQLTVMAQPMEQLGTEAAALLLKRIEKRTDFPEHVVLQAKLLEGNSVMDMEKEKEEKKLYKNGEKRLHSLD